MIKTLRTDQNPPELCSSI